MTLRHAACSLVFLVAFGTLVAGGAFVERSTSVLSAAIQPKVSAKDLAREEALTCELDETNRELKRRIELKDRLITELLAGRATLAAVTARFLELNQARPEYMAVIRRHFSGVDDTEKTAHNVVNYASYEIGRYCPIQRGLIVARLEFQLRKMTTYQPSAQRSH